MKTLSTIIIVNASLDMPTRTARLVSAFKYAAALKWKGYHVILKAPLKADDHVC